MWALGSSIPWEGRVCRKPWGLEDRDALRLSVQLCKVLWFSGVVRALLSSCHCQKPVRHSFYQTGYGGCRACLGRPRIGQRTRSSVHTHHGGGSGRARGYNKQRSRALCVRVRVLCVHTRDCVHTCVHVHAIACMFLRVHTRVWVCARMCGVCTSVGVGA